MGASLTRSKTEVINDVVNQTYQEARNECNADCNQIISGNTIILDGSTAGDVNFTQRCEANANCYMDNALEQLVENIQLGTAEADATAPLLPFGFSITEAEARVENKIRNEMVQVLTNICQADVTQKITDNIVFATDSTLGNIGFTQEGSATAECVMKNAARMKAANRQEGRATASAGNLFGGLIGIIMLVVVIVIVIGIIRGAKKKGGEEEGAPGATGTSRSRSLAIPGKSSKGKVSSGPAKSGKRGTSSSFARSFMRKK